MAGREVAIFISFDGASVSGITVEAAKIAKQLTDNGFKCYLDLGYDINLSKGNFGRPYRLEADLYHRYFELVRVAHLSDIANYTVEFLENVNKVLVSETLVVSRDAKAKILRSVDEVAAEVARKIETLWKCLNVSKVIVENGTLPENIIYSRALLLAIEQYGRALNLGNFVIWRDHDLMWSSEKKSMKYGAPPYPYATKPIKSRHITYITLNEKLRDELEAWSNFEVEVQVRKNAYNFSECSRRNIRPLLGIRESDILIARTTRLIPQKRVDRDIDLINRLNLLLRQRGGSKRAFLVIAGDKNENYSHYIELERLAKTLDTVQHVKFTGPLHHDFMTTEGNAFTIEDLYYSCDLVSFLTSYDYDSYGNPIGEAISQKRCYITTSYEYYHEVYGRHGFEAPILEISGTCDELPDQRFVDEVFLFLTNNQLMKAVAEKNFQRGKRVLSSSPFEV
ncbi:glycosyltransferase involved in cell wall biosynthesis [Rhizobium mesoamericanum]|uniref:hypothetical protein n=1 Tax=Rhizobium mesoamericanum TaxID=1079800 RepID=UPI002789325F|nr:hypothetical protein [Rhizobium mesoamericanum]MDQ0564275.1 glycosyltransferase involved in cell wall biosynthesis [Rhizobium mesoamericanum]